MIDIDTEMNVARYPGYMLTLVIQIEIITDYRAWVRNYFHIKM